VTGSGSTTTTREGGLAGTTALVTGASRGFGRAVACALAGAGVQVVGVARDRDALRELHGVLGPAFTPVAADAADPVTAGVLLDEHRPRTLVLTAGARPLSRPLHRHTWQTFSRNWEVDVAQTFHWVRETLLRPVPDGTVVTFSSGAAVHGSPISGGYAGAKAAVRFITSYANAEAEREALPIRFVSVLPDLTPTTGLGSRAVAAYAARLGVDVETFLARRGAALTPDHVGAAVLDLAGRHELDHDAYLLGAAGLGPLP
jgi:NAD(P)-dependent dehydrogenase (short-subunit alcohol dehydrogenase family)